MLRLDGQRYTSNRRTVVGLLAGSDRPLTIPEILHVEPRLAQSSLYRTLALLEEVGVVHRVTGSDEFARYELAENLAGHHHHLICSACGSVVDFTVSPQLERSLHQALGRVADAQGFRPDHHRLDLVGVCAACA